MMNIPVLLAHGALGPYDELIFAAVGVVFLIMMGISWLRSRNAPELDEPILTHDETPAAVDKPDRFRLD
ncbi:MAG: hypothetical protein SF123_23075 [Chloroflexota bacterium]|nr:hypothetical protein [Chloroflexota bacterium]